MRTKDSETVYIFHNHIIVSIKLKQSLLKKIFKIYTGTSDIIPIRTILRLFNFKYTIHKNQKILSYMKNLN